jgi:hypothetical protein
MEVGNVRFGSKADIDERDCHVRLVPKADIEPIIRLFYRQAVGTGEAH